MPTTRKQETYARAAHLGARLARVSELTTNRIGDAATELLRLADRLTRYAETDCNYGLSAKQEAQRLRLANRVLAICGELGVSCKLGGDPRGYVVRLMLPSGDYNTWGGPEEGWGI